MRPAGSARRWWAELRARGVATWGLSRRDDRLDLADESSIAAAVAALEEPPRLVLVATGLLHADGVQPEKSLAALDPGRLARSFAVNAIGPALLAKHLLPRMPRQGRSIFAVLSARVGSIADNRLGGWYGYRASKAGAEPAGPHPPRSNRRAARQAPIVVALHPGTVATGLSAPFRGQAEGVVTPEEAGRAPCSTCWPGFSPPTAAASSPGTARRSRSERRRSPRCRVR